MSANPCLTILLAATTFAGEAADRATICAAITALNELPQRAGLFTGDVTGLAGLDRLFIVKRKTFRILKPSIMQPAGPVTVTISREFRSV